MYIIWKIDGNCFYHCLVLSRLAAVLLKDLLGEGQILDGACAALLSFVLRFHALCFSIARSVRVISTTQL